MRKMPRPSGYIYSRTCQTIFLPWKVVTKNSLSNVERHFSWEMGAVANGPLMDATFQQDGQLFHIFVSLPFFLHAVQIRDIELPKIVRSKIEEVQLAKQEEQRLAMIEKQAAKNQLINTLQLY